jgi:hypothetical protein
VGVPEWGQSGSVEFARRMSLHAQRVAGGVLVTGVPQHDRVDDQAERGELTFLAFSLGLVDLAAFAMADRAGELVPGLLTVL